MQGGKEIGKGTGKDHLGIRLLHANFGRFFLKYCVAPKKNANFRGILKDNCVKSLNLNAAAQYLPENHLKLAHDAGKAPDSLKKSLKLANSIWVTQEFEKNLLKLALRKLFKTRLDICKGDCTAVRPFFH